MAVRDKIEGSVGELCQNRPIDVILVKDLINNHVALAGLKALLLVNGECDAELIEAIKSFQTQHSGIRAKKPDGKVAVNGLTFMRLQQCKKQAGAYRSTLPRGFEGNQLSNFNVDSFVALMAAQYPTPPMGAAAAVGLKSLMTAILADADVTDLRWAAYMLATVMHECGRTWLPIEEVGKGSGKDYSKAVTVKIDDKTTLQHVYYGRGYVQLTWDHRYKAIDTAFGFTGVDSLYLHPERALLPDVAYRIMSHGMRKGLFTGLGLGRFITGAKCGYYYARQIINGLDEATRIQGYAESIEFLLRFCNGVPLPH